MVRQTGTVLQWYDTDQAQAARSSGQEIFLKESRKMTRVNRIPQVVQILDLFLENDTAYIIMDFIEGETLKQRLEKSGPLSWQETQNIFLPVIRAMEQVHQAGLIHRDLSPDNLMLLPEGGVMILDLGAAKDLNLNSGASSMQVAKGGFSPLEQYTQRGSSGPWSDVYALAATMHYTLTGTVPPAAVDRMDEDNLQWDLPRLQALPTKTLETLQKAMALRAKDRIQSMEELLAGMGDLQQKEQPRPIQLEKPPVPKEPPAPVKAEITTPVKEQPKASTETKVEDGAKKRKNKPLYYIAALACGIAAVVLLWTSVIPQLKYNHAAEMMEAGQYESARDAFAALGDYKDSQKQSFDLWEEFTERETISAGSSCTLGLTANGTVLVAGQNQSASKWKDIGDISVGSNHVVGLKKDGTVVASGSNANHQCDVSGWKHIVAVQAGYYHTVGLKSDGTVVAVGHNGYKQCEVSQWSNITAVSAGNYYTVGLKSDGTVEISGLISSSQYNMSNWKEIVSVSAGCFHAIGLKSNGTVVAVGDNSNDQCSVSNWTGIVAVSAGGLHTVGLKADGSVVAVGANQFGQCDVSDWTDIVAISAGGLHTIGLKSDGTVVTAGDTQDGKCDAANWKGIKLPN